MSWTFDGFPSPMPLGIDFYTLSNEDQGFTANLVAGTNDVHAFALPFPATLNLFTQTIIDWATDFIFHATLALSAGTAIQALMYHQAMLDQEFSVSWFGNLTDLDDEALKAQYCGPCFFGQHRTSIVATAAVEGSQRENDVVKNSRYTPPVPLRLVSPKYIQYTNQSQTITLATNVVAEANFVNFEKVVVRQWFTRSNLTRGEMDNREVQIRFLRLDA